MAYDGSITLYTDVDTKGLKSGMNTIQNGAKSLTASISKLGAAIGIAFGIGALVRFGKEAVSLASDLEEVQNVVDVAFGDMAYKMEAFADSAIEMYGISKLTAKQTGSSYMAMADGMGIAEEAASDMSLSLTALSADMASFYNVSQEEARTALSSVFTGETETLKRYGILITEVNLQEYARQQGITKSITAMTQQEKVMLRYNYVLAATANAQGDFQRTQDSWANQTRILSERRKEMQATFGEAFKTIGTLILPAINTLITGLTKVAALAKQAAVNIAAMFGKEIDTSSGVSDNIQQSVSNQNDLTDAVKETEKAQKGMLAGFDELNNMSRDTGSDGNTTALPAAPVADSAGTKKAEKNISSFAQKAKKTFEGIATYLKQTFGPAFGEVSKLGSQVWDGMKDSGAMVFNDLQQNVFTPIGDTIKGTILPLFADMGAELAKTGQRAFSSFKNIFDTIYTGLISPFVARFVGIWTDMWESTKQIWDERGAGIFEGIRGFIQSIEDIFMSLWENYLSPLATRIGDVIDWLWEEHLKALWENIQTFAASLMEAVLTVWNNVLAPLVDWLITVLGPIVSNVLGSIMDVVGTVVALISDVVGGILKSLSGLLDFITGVFTGNWKKAWEGIKNFVKGIWDMIWGIIKCVINLIVDGLNLLWGGVYSVFAGIANGIGKAVGWVGSLFGQDWEFSMPKKPPLIPKLAQGAVLPANRPFLAQLGDQKNGTNLETPESLLRQIYAEENAPMVVLLQQMLEVLKRGTSIQIDGREILMATRNAENRAGRQTVTGGFANVY